MPGDNLLCPTQNVIILYLYFEYFVIEYKLMPRLPLTIEYALLGFLYQRPRHGYEIHQQLLESEGPGLVWRPKQSQVYALLNKLEQQGYITAVVEAGETYPPRKTLHLTPAGRAALWDWLQTPTPQARKMRQEFMAKLYFAHQMAPPLTAVLIANQREKCQEWLAACQSHAESFAAEQRFEWLLYQFRLGQIDAMSRWLDICEQELASLSPH